jgi:hypothetical protein
MALGKWVNKNPYGWFYEGHGWGVYWVKRAKNGQWYAFHEEFGGKPVGIGNFATRKEAQASVEAMVQRLAEHKVRKNPVARFKNLAVGELFTFAREHDSRFNTSGMPAGPWRKTSARGYTHALSGGSFKVGTTGVEVQGSEVRGKNPVRRKRNPLPEVHLSNGHHYTPVLVVMNDGEGWYLFKGEPGKSTGVRAEGSYEFHRTRKAAVARGVRLYGVTAITEAKWLNMRGTNPVKKKRRGRKPMSATARRQFAARMAAARARKANPGRGRQTRRDRGYQKMRKTEVKIANRRVAIKRQIRRAGHGAGLDPQTSTKSLRAQRAALHPRGMFQIGALSAAKQIAWWAGRGFTLLRGDAVGYATLPQARERANKLERNLVLGIFRSDVSAERARNFLLGKK